VLVGISFYVSTPPAPRCSPRGCAWCTLYRCMGLSRVWVCTRTPTPPESFCCDPGDSPCNFFDSRTSPIPIFLLAPRSPASFYEESDGLLFTLPSQSWPAPSPEPIYKLSACICFVFDILCGLKPGDLRRRWQKRRPNYSKTGFLTFPFLSFRPP